MKLFNDVLRQLPLLCTAGLVHVTAHAGDTTQVYLGEGKLNYDGYLDTQANERLFALYDSLKAKPKTLAIRSRGGPVVLGMALGEWVHAHQLDVKVMEFCLSSCANYVFTAGTRKIVSSHAMIGFHGGLSSKEVDIGGPKKREYDAMTVAEKAAYQAAIRRELQPQHDRETAFFNRIGVRQDITTYGQEPRFDATVMAGWTFTQEGFASFGVHHIDIINPPWKPRLLTVDANIITLKVH